MKLAFSPHAWGRTGARKLAFAFLFAVCGVSTLNAQSNTGNATGRARIALFEPAGQKSDAALTAVLATVADSVELSLDVLQRYEVRRLPPADPAKDLARVKAYCQANRIDQAIMGSGSARPEGGYLFKLEVYDRRSDSITLAPEGSSTGALDMFDVTDKLVGTLLDGLSGTHLLFGSLSVETDPSGATVSVNGKEMGTAPVSLRGLPAGAVQVSAKLAGHEDVNATVTISDGESTDTPLSLARSTGTLALAVPRDAVVTVSSAEIGKKDLNGPGAAALPTGDYDVQAASPGLPAAAGKVSITRNAATPYLPWPKGYLDVQTAAAGATIVVDGVDRGVAPLVVDVDPGTPHHVELKREKYQTYTTDISAAAGDKAQLAPTLVGLPGSIRVETSLPEGLNFFSASSNAPQVKLDDGQSVDMPHVFEDVPAGKHVVLIDDIRAGSRMYTVGGPIQVDVRSGETTVVSKTYEQAVAHLTIKDAPTGSIIAIDEENVDSASAVTTGVNVAAGEITISVLSPSSQVWSGHTNVAPGASEERSVLDLTWNLARRNISMKGNKDDWSGLVPIWDSVRNYVTFPGQPGTQITRGFACRDDKFVYFRYDFSNGSPSAKLAPGIAQLDYIQIINTGKGEVTGIVKFGRGANGTSTLGIRNPSRNQWTGLGDGVLKVHVGEGMMEVAIPLDRIKSYLNGASWDTQIFLVNSVNPSNANWSSVNSTPLRPVGYGF